MKLQRLVVLASLGGVALLSLLLLSIGSAPVNAQGASAIGHPSVIADRLQRNGVDSWNTISTDRHSIYAQEDRGPSIVPSYVLTYYITLTGLQKNNGGVSSRYIISNTESSVVNTATAHHFYANDGTNITDEESSIPALGSRTYDLANIDGLPDGYRGYVTVEAEQSITGTVLEAACSSNQWYGEYYDNRDLQGLPVFARCDDRIDFYWGREDSPAHRVPTDNFSVRWKRRAEFPKTGWYHFRAFTDDGLRLYIDGEQIIDDWVARSFTERSALKKLNQGPHEVTMEYVEWSHEAMAHLTWYRSLICPDSAIECRFDITPMYQTWYLDKPMPKQCSTVKNQTIARWGCLITSYAMAIQTLGVDIDPDKLNDLLSAEGSYSSTCNGSIYSPDKPGESAITKVISKTYKIRLKWVPVRTADEIKTALRNGRPVIMRYSFANDNKHFFLATDIIGSGDNEYLGILDPLHAWTCRVVSANDQPPPVISRLECLGPALEHYTAVQERFAGAVPVGYVEKATQPQTPSLQFYVRGAEILLTDVQGRQVGYDRGTGQIIFEIPASFYYDSEIVPPGGESDGIARRTLFLPEYAGGDYQLQVVGLTSLIAQVATSFEITAIGFDGQFNPTEAKVSGTVLPGGTLKYQVSFNPGQGLTISPKDSLEVYLPVILKYWSLDK